MFGSLERVESSVSFVVLSYEGPREIGKANAHTHIHTHPHPPSPPPCDNYISPIKTRANKNKQRSHLVPFGTPLNFPYYCNLRDPFLIEGDKTICITVRGGKTRLPKSKFSENFHVCSHMILQIQIKKKFQNA